MDHYSQFIQPPNHPSPQRSEARIVPLLVRAAEEILLAIDELGRSDAQGIEEIEILEERVGLGKRAHAGQVVDQGRFALIPRSEDVLQAADLHDILLTLIHVLTAGKMLQRPSEGILWGGGPHPRWRDPAR